MSSFGSPVGRVGGAPEGQHHGAPPAPDMGTPRGESATVEPYLRGPISAKLDRQVRLCVTGSNRHRIQEYEKL